MVVAWFGGYSIQKERHVSPTIPIILALVAIGWFVVAGLHRKTDPGLAKLGVIGGILALVMAAVVSVAGVAKLVISAVVAIPLLVATIVEFGFIIAVVSRLFRGKVSQGAFLAGILTIIGAILIGVVLMFQPFTPKVFNLGFDFVLIALLAFNVWSHVTPREAGLARGLSQCNGRHSVQHNESQHTASEKYGYRFSFGPWNIHEGADPFGPAVRPSLGFAQKLMVYKELGFDAVQFHDDDAVPNLDELSPAQVGRVASQTRQLLEDHGLVAEFVAPRLWESPRTIDGGFTSNNAGERRYALDRTKQCADIARELGCDLIVLWLAAREPTCARARTSSGLRTTCSKQ